MAAVHTKNPLLEPQDVFPTVNDLKQKPLANEVDIPPQQQPVHNAEKAASKKKKKKKKATKPASEGKQDEVPAPQKENVQSGNGGNPGRLKINYNNMY